MDDETIITEDSKIREYTECIHVKIIEGIPPGGTEPRLAVKAYNEAGCCWTEVDLLDVLQWVKRNKPGLLMEE